MGAKRRPKAAVATPPSRWSAKSAASSMSSFRKSESARSIRRSSTYATSRLTEGVDVYFLAKQMGTSVKMIEDHYGHITPVKNAERILQGLPGWEPIAAVTQVAVDSGSVNGDATETTARAPRPQRRKTA